MNQTNNTTLLRIQRSVDRMESMLKSIDKRVLHLHTKMLADTSNNAPQKTGSYFARTNKNAPQQVTSEMIQSLLWRPPSFYSQPQRKPSATRKLTIHS